MDNAHVQKQRILQGKKNEILKVRTQLIIGAKPPAPKYAQPFKKKIEHENNVLQNNEKEERKL